MWRNISCDFCVICCRDMFWRYCANKLSIALTTVWQAKSQRLCLVPVWFPAVFGPRGLTKLTPTAHSDKLESAYFSQPADPVPPLRCVNESQPAAQDYTAQGNSFTTGSVVTVLTVTQVICCPIYFWRYLQIRRNSSLQGTTDTIGLGTASVSRCWYFIHTIIIL